MPSRLWPNPTPRAAVSSAFAISPRQCVDLCTVLFGLRPHPVYYPVRFEPAGPTRQVCGRDTILPFAFAAGKPARRTAPEDVQGRPRNLWLAIHHAFFVSTDTVQTTYLSASG